MLSYTVKALQELNTKVDDNAARARKEICLDTSVGTQVCITGDQLHALLQDSHVSGAYGSVSCAINPACSIDNASFFQVKVTGRTCMILSSV